MLELLVGSLLVGSLGIQTVLVSGWLRWRQVIINQQNEEQEEEEILTSFESQEDIIIPEPPSQNGYGLAIQASRDPRLVGWEFKIVRTKGDLFRNPAIFQQLCEEEELAGWILLEKLDDRRVRFKRPLALRDMINPEFLSYDPYRCYYGPSWTPMTWVGISAAIVTLIVPAYIGYTFVSRVLAHSPQRSPEPPSQQQPFPEQPPTP